MSSESQALFLCAAFVCFVVAAVLAATKRSAIAVTVLTNAGLALFVFVPFWVALDAS